MAKENTLDDTPLEETSLTDQGSNLYKFYMAHCINEIVCRYRLNQDKRNKIFAIRDMVVEDYALNGLQEK